MIVMNINNMTLEELEELQKEADDIEKQINTIIENKSKGRYGGGVILELPDYALKTLFNYMHVLRLTKEKNKSILEILSKSIKESALMSKYNTLTDNRLEFICNKIAKNVNEELVKQAGEQNEILRIVSKYIKLNTVEYTDDFGSSIAKETLNINPLNTMEETDRDKLITWLGWH